ncbi:C-C chemokine receptor type 6 [Megalops cyprinoides]|uniref:C-C chemokine receptor type 6 n=1 Tax=Megalops cyprinoides TaxID=118141 RepID=UPI001864A4B0|nr:C-C chemokine receptor type 6 [Megalops cyprinoides]
MFWMNCKGTLGEETKAHIFLWMNQKSVAITDYSSEEKGSHKAVGTGSIMAASELTVTPNQGLSDEYDYTHYYQYGDELHENYGLCDKAHVKTFARIFLPIFYVFVCTLDIVGNTLLVAVLIKYIKLRSTTSIYLLNMAFSDILFAVTLPFWAVYVHSGWIFGDAGCKLQI